MARTVIIIPAYKPNNNYIELVRELRKSFFVLTVNDGSPEECTPLFREAAEIGARVLIHEKNRGKGAALKTAINHLIGWEEDWVAVTADADGQHSVEDIKKVARLAEESPDAMVLGIRDFKQLPFRSRFGNKVTRGCFYLVTHNRIMDTQTGLRGFSSQTAKLIVTADGDRYEYEMNVLLRLKEWGIPTVETVIDPVRGEGTAASHFHPVRDSITVFGQVIKHTVASLACTLLDYIIYLLLIWWVFSAEMAYIVAKTVSVLVNYQLSKRIVFKTIPDWRTTTAYYMLAICTMSVGAILIMLCTNYLGANEAIIKLPVDTLLFFVNFFVQKYVVFK